MLVDHSTDKLHNAIAYFVANTRFCGKTKLYKLLYFLDFEHYSKTGRSVTSLEYFAWPMGPVPVSVHNQIDDCDSSLHELFEIKTRESASGYQIFEFVPEFEFDGSNFSRRELRILSQLATEYECAVADDMVEATHLENLPWDRTYNQLGLRQQSIPYKLALKPSEADEMNRLISENEDFGENYR